MLVSSFNFENLHPPLEVNDIKHSDHYIHHGEGKKCVRKIFCKVPFDDFEKDAINALKNAIESENIVLPPYWEERHFLIYCYNGGFLIENSLRNLKMHLEWVNNPKWQTVTDTILTIWNQGMVYSFGVDKWFRPIIIVNVYMFDLKKYEADDYLSAVCCLLSVIRRHMFVPGHVENWNVIIEAKNKSLWSLSSYYDLIKRIIQTLSVNFSSTLEKQFILNPPSILSVCWGVIEKWLNPETAAKISFASGKIVNQKLLELIDPDQLEEKYGGTVPNLTEFWPPKTHFKSKHHNKVLLKKKSTNFHLTTEEEKDIFYSLDHISENQYELLKKNENSYENFQDLEFKDSSYLHQIQLETHSVKPSKFCGMCEASSNSNTNKDSSCILI